MGKDRKFHTCPAPVRANFAHQDGAVQSDGVLVRVAELEQTGQGGGGVSLSGGEYVKSHSGRLVSGYRTSGVVGSQWLGLGWRVRVALSFFNWNPAPGSYTRYGDVRVLLESADDRLIVMARATK